jgi:ADP-ribosylglycohydrolase
VDLPVIPIIPVKAESSGCASSGCGSAPDALAHLPDHIRQKVQDHPCYSEQAHHYFAHMHVAVAPACNIQCNYCNRKFDCANESRPGVVSDAACDTLVAMLHAVLKKSEIIGAGRTAQELNYFATVLVVKHPQFAFDGRRRENPSGFVVETLQEVFQALFDTDNFEDCLVDVVNRGGDADTTGAINGMLAGACYGIPSLAEGARSDSQGSLRNAGACAGEDGVISLTADNCRLVTPVCLMKSATAMAALR